MSAAPKLSGTDFLARVGQTKLSTKSVPGVPTTTNAALPLWENLPQYTLVPSRETDLYAWLLHQANELRSRKPDFIDWDDLAEELDETVAIARKEVVSRFRTLLAHLLKWKYQSEKRDESSWRTTIVNQRQDLSLLLESQNLGNYLEQVGYAKAYEMAREAAGAEMQLERITWRNLFPSNCEWTPEEALNVDFLPTPVEVTIDHFR